MKQTPKEIQFVHLKTAALPYFSAAVSSSSTPQISFLVPAKGGAEILATTIEQIHQYLSVRFAESFEIILIPNPVGIYSGQPLSQENVDLLKVACELKKKFKELRIIPHELPRGKSAALKTGFMASRGKWIFTTDNDLPFDLSFFDQAADQLRAGKDFVIGNRRRSDSKTIVPAGMFLRYVRRYFLSRCFSFAVRTMMPIIKIRDTQAGIKAMTREFAELAFRLQTCPGFYGDLELLLSALHNNKKVADLPVILTVDDNKSSVNFRKELSLAFYWIFKIASRQSEGLYKEASVSKSESYIGDLIEIITEETEFPSDLVQSRGF